MTIEAPQELWIAQVTDTHIMAKGAHWKGCPEADTAGRLEKVVADINALSPPPALVIHTGDVTEHGDLDAYRHAKELLDLLQMPYFLTCGNHDHFGNLKTVFSDHHYFQEGAFSHYVIDHYPVQIIVMDSTIAGKSYGGLCTARQNWLRQVLEKTARDTMLFLHHYPIDVQDPVLTSLQLRDDGALAALLGSSPHIKRMYCGHQHHASVGCFAEIPCWISPSTAPSHVLRENRCVGLHLTQAAYSLHRIHSGTVVSRVIPISETSLLQ